MGIVNVTPDSFSDGGRFTESDIAIAHGLELRKAGAAIIDVGGESTRPGAAPVTSIEELSRVLPVIRGLAEEEATVSIDTSKATVAAAALAAGATIVNDISGLTKDPGIGYLCAEYGATVVLMHSPPKWPNPHTSEVVGGMGPIVDWLSLRIEAAIACGISESRIWIDPGIGFGKTNPEGNLEILRSLDELNALGRPILVGPSRKAFIGSLDGSLPSERLGGTIASCLVAATTGADVLRVHDVAPIAQALTVAAAAAGDTSFELHRCGLPGRTFIAESIDQQGGPSAERALRHRS
jgi:dihydropteroate synthase